MAQNDILDDLISSWAYSSRLPESSTIFYKIRNIPYMLYPELMNNWAGALEMLRRNCGSCSPKHFLMARMFNRLNLETRLVTYPFVWQEQSIIFPAKLKIFLHKLPISYHVACQIKVNNEWLSVDATFDPPLKKFGFIVNEWGGKNSTPISFYYREKIVHKSEDDRSEYVKGMRSLIPDEQKILEKKFHQELNVLFEELREYSRTNHL